jgi:hypothetical protein
MRFSEYRLLLSYTAGPFLLTVLAAMIGWFYRRVVLPAPRRPHLQVSEEVREGPQLSMTKAEAVANAPAGSDAAHAREDAYRVNARVRWSHVWAWLVCTALVWSLYVAFTSATFSSTVKLAVGCTVLVPQILILLWAIDWPVWRRVTLLFLYAGTGVFLFRIALPHAEHPWRIVWYTALAGALIPIPGLLLLFIRRNQPFLLLLIAILGYFLGTGFLLDRFRYSTTTDVLKTVIEKPWLIPAGLLNISLGVVGARLLLRQRRWSLCALVVVAGAIAAVLLDRDVARQSLPEVVRFACFVALSVLQVLAVWSLFKGFVWLGERRFLTPELVQVHLCWIFLTVYFMDRLKQGRGIVLQSIAPLPPVVPKKGPQLLRLVGRWTCGLPLFEADTLAHLAPERFG